MLTPLFNAERTQLLEEAIAAFFAQIEQFNFQQFSRFPSFGYLDPQQSDPRLCDRLVAATRFSKTEIQRAIARRSVDVKLNTAL